MCRFALYLGPELFISKLVTEPTHSIIHQSHHSRLREEPLNGDGFGVGWFAASHPGQPALFRSVSPAWNDQNLAHLARVTQSRCILAHIRAASPGLPVSSLNCHPFGHGRLAFMHNGYLAGFSAYKRAIHAKLDDEAFHLIKGSTDSEHAFALFWQILKGYGQTTQLKNMIAAMQATINTLEELRHQAGITIPSKLNFAVSDGERALVTRYMSDHLPEANSLFLSQGRRYVCRDGLCAMEPIASQTDRSVLFASEPLSEDDSWREVPINHLVAVDTDLEPSTIPLG